MMRLRSLAILLLAFAAPLFAQSQPAPIPFHHFSFNVPDFDANVTFWQNFGATQQPGQANARFTIFHFPSSDVVVSILEDKTASGGSVGSVIDHIGFQVPDVPTAVAKWKAAGIKTEAGRNDQQAYIYTPDDVKIEILQDATLTVPVKAHHVHFYTAVPLETQAWYVKMFGATPGKRGPFDNATVPNINLTFTKADGVVASTKGRALSHIGFEVSNIDQAKKDFEAKGVTFDPALQPPAGRGPTRTAFFLDPWGTLIELIQLVPATAGR
jgi:catechol 2,3-dioxygenase-like lactoylglutathione lyase family enzyme